jgi:hypothetical protein
MAYPRRLVPGLALLAALAATGPAFAQTSISLLAIPEEGLWGPDLERIENGFRKAVLALGSYEIQARADTIEHFADARDMGIDCQKNDVDCATKIGVIAGADKVLLMRAAPREGSFYLTLLVVDVASPENATRVTQWAPTSGEGHERAIREAAVRLFEPDKHKGSVRIYVNPKDAAITLDGAPATRDGRGVIGGVSAGDHTVAVSLAGYQPFTRSVHVRFDETVELRVELQPGEAAATTTTTTASSDPSPATDGSAPATDGTGGETPAAADQAPSEAPTALSPFVLGGGIAAGVGVLGVITGGVVTLYGLGVASDLSLSVPDRRTGQTIGIGGVTLAVLSSAVVVTGGAAIGWGLVEAAPVE